MSITWNADTLHTMINKASADLARAVGNEMELEDGRGEIKSEAIGRIMARGDNKLTGKPHSVTSAETLVSADPAYIAHMAKLRAAARERIMARGAYDALVAASRGLG